MKTTSRYKQKMQTLTHLYEKEINHFWSPDIYYHYEIPIYVKALADSHNKPAREVLNDMINYRNSFSFQRDRSTFIASQIEEAA